MLKMGSVVGLMEVGEVGWKGADVGISRAVGRASLPAVPLIASESARPSRCVLRLCSGAPVHLFAIVIPSGRKLPVRFCRVL